MHNFWRQKKVSLIVQVDPAICGDLFVVLSMVEGKMKNLSVMGFVLLTTFLGSSNAASDADIDRLTTYAVLIGRAIACGEDTSYASKRVGAWMDEKFPPGSEDQQVYLPIFVAGVRYHAGQQRDGNSPDSCSTVSHQFGLIDWP